MNTRRLFSGLLLAGVAAVLLITWRWWDHPKPVRDGTAPGSHGAVAPRPASTSLQPQSREPVPSDPASLEPQAAATIARLRHMLATLEPVLPGELENKAAIELLQWWAELEPEAAIAYAMSHPDLHGRTVLPAELFASWLDVKGDVAMTWVEALPPGELRSRLMPTVISLVAEQRPQEALRMAAELEGPDRLRALSAIFTEWSAVDPVAAAIHANQLPSVDEQNMALQNVLAKWADRDLGAAVEWIRRFPPNLVTTSTFAPSVLDTLIEKWASQAPMDAARYLVATPEGTKRIQMLSTVAGQWASQNPNEALRWAASLAGEADRSTMVRGVLAGVAQSNVQAAADLALTLPAGAAQRQGIELILSQWTATDPVGVADWATSRLHSHPSAETISSVVSAWAGADLASLGEWLGAQPLGSARDTGYAALARYLAPTHPDIAIAWADAISDPSLRQQQLANINRSHATNRRGY